MKAKTLLIAIIVLLGGLPVAWASGGYLSQAFDTLVFNTFTGSSNATSTTLGSLVVGSSTVANAGQVEIHGIDYLASNSRGVQLGVYNTGTQSIDRGGVIGLGGTSGTTLTTYGAIACRKENSTGGNTQGYCSFFARPVSGAMTTEAARISSNKVFSVGSSTPSASSTMIVVATTGVAGNGGLATTTLTIGSPSSRFCIETWNDAGTLSYIHIVGTTLTVNAGSCK